LAPSDPTYLLHLTSSLGRLSVYHVDVRSSSHISAVLAFANTHNVRLSTKNTGHDYFGCSAVPNSSTLWTQNLNSLELEADLTLSGCAVGSPPLTNIETMGAGVIARDACVFSMVSMLCILPVDTRSESYTGTQNECFPNEVV
jgi:hypothetical protein